jgi:branched-chain amino acid transport system substrate-binding protein
LIETNEEESIVERTPGKFIAAAIVPLLIAVIAAGESKAADSKGGAAAPVTVKIGLPIPLSGAGASIGQRFQKAAEIAIEDLNKMAGSKMRFVSVTEDSKCEPNGAQTAAKKLILQDNVNVMVGELCSSATLAIKDLAGQNKVPLVVPDSSALNITEQGNPYTFRIIPNEVQQHIALARIAINYMKQKNFVVTYEQTDSGVGAGKTFIGEAKKLGGNILDEMPLDRNTPDFTPVVTRIKALKPEAIHLTMLLDPSIRFLKALYEQGVRVPVYSSIWYAYPLFESLAGPASDGHVRELFYIDSAEDPEAVAFTKRFKGKFPGETPDFNHAQFYVAMMLAGEVAIKNGGDRESIRKGLAATKDYKSAIGPISFDAKGQTIMKAENIVFIQTKGGKVEVLDKRSNFDKKKILGL